MSMTPVERLEREKEQANKYKIMDQHVLAKEAEVRSARDVKSAKTIAWVSFGVSMVGTIAAIIALFK